MLKIKKFNVQYLQLQANMKIEHVIFIIRLIKAAKV